MMNNNNNRAIVPHHGRRGMTSSSMASSNRIMTSNTNATSNRHYHTSAANPASNRPGTTSTSMMNTNSSRPTTANSTAAASAATAVRIPPPTLLCNLCQKPLATTCFLCACECVFCEECTYSHFEQSSHCPICRKTLTENDFTELVVADATTSSTNDTNNNNITKTTLQTLFTKHSKSSNIKGLPYSDLCYSLIRQMDVVKQSTKFLLKQLLMHSNTQNRKVAFVLKQNDKLKSDMTLLKQGQSTQRIQYEQINNDLKNRLNARESTIQELNVKLAEKERMIEQFRRLHRGNNGDGNRSIVMMDNTQGSSSGGGGDTTSISGQSYHHQIPPSTGASNRHRNVLDPRSRNNRSGSSTHNHHHNHQFSSGNSIASNTRMEPPLKGLMMQRQANQMAQQKALISRRGPNMPSSKNHNMGPPPPSTQPFTRPFSSNNSISSNSISSNTPRVRDLSHNTSFNFSGGSNSGGASFSGGGGGQRLNKRRRSDINNPSSSTTPAASHIMSPSTAFTLNQGAHTVNRGPRWMQRDGDNYSVR